MPYSPITPDDFTGSDRDRIQAALNAVADGQVVLLNRYYTVSGGDITLPAYKRVTLRGTNAYNAVVRFTSNNGFVGANINHLQLESFGVQAAGNFSAAAFNITSGVSVPTVRARELAIIADTYDGTQGFRYGFRLNNTGQCRFDDVFVYGVRDAGGAAIYMTADGGVNTDHYVTRCHFQNIDWGVRVKPTNGAVEGFHVLECSMVDVKIGVDYDFSGYYTSLSPQFTVKNSHIATRGDGNCIKMNRTAQLDITGNLLYSQGISVFLTGVFLGTVRGNIFTAVARSNGVWMNGASSGIAIDSNIFQGQFDACAVQWPGNGKNWGDSNVTQGVTAFEYDPNGNFGTTNTRVL